MLQKVVENFVSSLTRSRIVERLHASNPALADWFGVSGGKVVVTEKSGQSYVTVGSCIFIISSDIATMPYSVYKKGSGKRQPVSDHSLSELFSGMVNSFMDVFTFNELRMEDLLGWGNFVAIKEFDRRGRIIALWPVRPWNVRVELRDRILWYHIYGSDGVVREYNQDQVYHVKAPGSRGIWGISVIRKHALTIGVGMKTEAGLDALLENGARQAGYLTTSGKLDPKAKENLQKGFKDKYTGYQQFGTIPVFDNGMEWKTINLPLHDVAFLQQAKYSDVKTAMMFRMPLYKLGIMDQAKFNNVEHMATEYFSNTLHGWIRRIEIADKTQLLTPEEQRNYYTKFNISAFLRGDTAARWRSYDVGRRIGVYSANDINELEDRDPIEGPEGDMRIVPSNMMSIEKMVDYVPGQRSDATSVE